MTVASDRLRHIDHGYASTSHSAQGATVDHVIVDIDTRLSPELVAESCALALFRLRGASLQNVHAISKLQNSVLPLREADAQLGGSHHSFLVTFRNSEIVAFDDIWLVSLPLLRLFAVSPFCRNCLKVSVEDTVYAGKSGRAASNGFIAAAVHRVAKSAAVVRIDCERVSRTTDRDIKTASD